MADLRGLARALHGSCPSLRCGDPRAWPGVKIGNINLGRFYGDFMRAKSGSDLWGFKFDFDGGDFRNESLVV